MSDVTKTCRDISELTEQAQKACNLFMDKCKAKGLNVLITETYRSQARQNYLYEQGRSREGKIVTWTKNSRHTSRRAWDVCKNAKGQEYSDSNFFKQCGDVAAELGITWGGTWKSSPDTPHFEIDTNWKEPITTTEDKELSDAVSKIVKSGIAINYNQWKTRSLINLNYVPALLMKLGGVPKLYNDKVIGDKQLWLTGQYNVNHVRSLLIKYSNTL